MGEIGDKFEALVAKHGRNFDRIEQMENILPQKLIGEVETVFKSEALDLFYLSFPPENEEEEE